MNDRELIDSFESGRLSSSEFRHVTHVQLTRAYLERDPLPLVLVKLRDGLLRFATVNGVPEKYHETITFAFATLINERRLRQAPHTTFEEFRTANPDLFDKKMLETYYRPETLASTEARNHFILPDKALDSGRR